jgi:hypothetical protein
VKLLTKTLLPKPATLRIEDATDYFSWMQKHRLWHGYNHKREAAAVVETEGEAPVLLTGDDLKPLSAVIVKERGGLPGGLSAKELADVIRRLTRKDPRGHLGAADVMLLEFSPMADESTEEYHRWQQIRQLGSREPVLVHHGGGESHLEFYFWTQIGSLEQWTVEMGAKQIHRATKLEIAPPKTFNYPFV